MNVFFSIDSFKSLSCPGDPVALGMESGAISDGQITASTWVAERPPWDGRLRKPNVWKVQDSNYNQWLQIDLLSYYIIVARVATQGKHNKQQYVTSYNLQYSDDGVHFQYYTEGKTTPKVR